MPHNIIIKTEKFTSLQTGVCIVSYSIGVSSGDIARGKIALVIPTPRIPVNSSAIIYVSIIPEYLKI